DDVVAREDLGEVVEREDEAAVDDLVGAGRAGLFVAVGAERHAAQRPGEADRREDRGCGLADEADVARGELDLARGLRELGVVVGGGGPGAAPRARGGGWAG